MVLARFSMFLSKNIVSSTFVRGKISNPELVPKFFKLPPPNLYLEYLKTPHFSSTPSLHSLQSRWCYLITPNQITFLFFLFKGFSGSHCSKLKMFCQLHPCVHKPWLSAQSKLLQTLMLWFLPSQIVFHHLSSH